MSETAVHAAGADPTTVIAVAAGAAVLFPTIEAVWRRLRNSAESSPPTDVPQEDVRSIFDELEASWDSAATKTLDDALVDLANELDPEVAQAKLDAAVKQWCIDRSEGAGNPPSQAQMLKVLRSVVQNAREASYRELFADHYRRLENSVDPSARPRLDKVYIRLRPEIREGAVAGPDDLSSDQAAEQILAHEYLDFRDKTSGDVEVALRQSGNLVILGEPGSGKSTLLRYLAASCAESESTNALLPVFLRLRDYSDGQEMRIHQSAVTFAERDLQSLKMHEDFFDKALSDGRCVVFLDALDEVPAEQRPGIVNRVEQLTRSYPGSRFVVTSRIAGYNEAPMDSQIFTRYVAEAMDDDGIADFIGQLFVNHPERAQSLHNLLNANSGVKSLVSNPLLLAILGLVHQDVDAGLPLSRAKFYERAVEHLVADRDDDGKSSEPDEDQTTHKALLTATALFLHNENRETIHRGELEQQAVVFFLEYEGKPVPPRTRKDRDDAFRIAKAFIERAEQRTGLLVEQPPGSGDFGFFHATFREYLTAEEIKDRHSLYDWDREECWEEIKVHLTDPRWREVILLLLGSLDERYCTYLTKQILAAGDEAPHYYLGRLYLSTHLAAGDEAPRDYLERWYLPIQLQLAADALANQAPMSIELQQKIVERLKTARESAYRELFADHYRRPVSFGRRDRSLVDDVFIRLKADVQRDAPGELDVPEYLDFHGDTPTEVEATLRQSSNLVILGEPGSGKSTLLRYLAASCAQSVAADPLLPVFLPLKEYAGGQENLIVDRLESFAEFVLQIHLPDPFFEDALVLQIDLPEGFFEDFLRRGRCVVCLDALDEVPAEQRRGIVNRVEELTRRYPRSRFIVTSRSAGYDEAPLDSQIFTRYVAEPMDDAGIEAFIDRLCADDTERAQNLRDVLAVNQSIKSLVSNPLLMSILNLVHQNADTGLPLNRAKFYEQAVKILIDDDASREINPDWHHLHKMLLTATAFFLHNENRETIGRRKLEELAAGFLLEYRGKSDDPTRADIHQAYLESKDFIERAERRTGLLVEQDRGSGVFSFVHATLRQYLVAEDIHARHLSYRHDREECWEEIKDHLTDTRWREVILLLLSSLDERYCTYLTEQILAAGDLWLVAEALANQAPMSSELQQEIAERLEIINHHSQ